MKHVKISVLVYFFSFFFLEISAQTGGGSASMFQALSSAKVSELDCIGAKVLGERATQMQLVDAIQGYAGYYLKYDLIYSGVPIYRGGPTVVLKDNLMLNKMLPPDIKANDISGSSTVTYSASQAKTILNTNVSNTSSALYKGKYWIKPLSTWLVGHRYMASKSDETGYAYYWVDAVTGDIYTENGLEFQKLSLRPSNPVSKMHNYKMKEIKSSVNEEMYYTAGPNQSSSALIYKRYPTNGSLIEVSVPLQNGFLAGHSNLKYSEDGNTLEPSDSDDFNFLYTSEKESYCKTYAWVRMKELFETELFETEFNVRMNVFYNSPTVVGYNIIEDLIKFGTSALNAKPYAMDEFWIAFAGEDYRKQKFSNASSAVGSAIYSGYIDYLAQNRLKKLSTNDHVCNYWGGRVGTIDPFTTNSDQPCLIGNSSVQTRNAISTLLAQIHLDETNLGKEVVDNIMTDILRLNPEKFQLELPYLFIKEFWQTARLIQENNQLPMAKLCNLRGKLNTYFLNCVDWEPITDHIADLMIRDFKEDIGSEPHAFEQLYVSPDIWNTNSQGIGSPLEPVIGVQNTMHVKIKNVGCDAETGKKLKVYWNFASMGLAWDTDFDFDNPNISHEDWTKLANEPVISLEPGTDGVTYTIPWIPVDPATKGLESHKVCIYARITNADDEVQTALGAPFGETTSIGDNIKKNNGISLRNMTLIPKGPGIVGDPNDDDIVTVYIEDPEPPTVWPPDPVNPDTRLVDITCVVNLPPNSTGDPLIGVIDLANPVNYDPKAPIGPGSSQSTGTGPSQYPESNTAIDCERGQPTTHVSDPDFFNKGDVWINIKRADAQNWGGMTMQGTGFTTGTDGWIKMTGLNFNLTSLPLVKGVKYLLGVKYKPKVGFAPSSFSLMERDAITKDVIGGEAYIVTEDDIVVDDINDSSVQSRFSKKLDDLLFHPNPTTGIVNISLPNNQNFSNVKIYNLIGQLMYNQDIKQKSSEYQCNVQSWAEGSYIVKIETICGERYSQKFIKN